MMTIQTIDDQIQQSTPQKSIVKNRRKDEWNSFYSENKFLYGIDDSVFEKSTTRFHKTLYLSNILIGCFEGFFDAESNKPYNTIALTTGNIIGFGIAATQCAGTLVGTIVRELDDEEFSNGKAFVRGSMIGFMAGALRGSASWDVLNIGYAVGYGASMLKNYAIAQAHNFM